MSKFTKGTWKYLDAIYEVCAFDENAKWPNGWPKDITGELSWNGSEEERHANGRLIAAAPEMYELLRMAAQSLRNHSDDDGLIAFSISQLISRIDGDMEITASINSKEANP